MSGSVLRVLDQQHLRLAISCEAHFFGGRRQPSTEFIQQLPTFAVFFSDKHTVVIYILYIHIDI